MGPPLAWSRLPPHKDPYPSVPHGLVIKDPNPSVPHGLVIKDPNPSVLHGLVIKPTWPVVFVLLWYVWFFFFR